MKIRFLRKCKKRRMTHLKRKSLNKKNILEHRKGQVKTSSTIRIKIKDSIKHKID